MVRAEGDAWRNNTQREIVEIVEVELSFFLDELFFGGKSCLMGRPFYRFWLFDG